VARNGLAVTGANGFVGRHLLRLAASRGYEVVGVVRSEAASAVVMGCGGRPVLAGLGSDPLARAFAGATAVVHLAQVGGERHGGTFEAVSVRGTQNVVTAARQAGVRRVVFFSGLGVARYGMARRCTNAYFLSKLAAELALFRSGLDVTVFRPSYVLGVGGELVPGLLRELASGEVEVVEDGRYRMQPVAANDAAALILAGVEHAAPGPEVYDLVGPEPIAYADFVARVAGAARAQGRLAGDYRVRSLSAAEAEQQAAAGGYRGLRREELDCLLCDEVSDPRPLESLLGRPLTRLDDVIAAAVRGA
jgi:NADH dehydrogenase